MADSSPIVGVLGKAYQPAAILVFAIIAIVSLLVLGDTALSNKIDRQIQGRMEVQQLVLKSADEKQTTAIDGHETRIRALESTMSQINTTLVEIKSDVKYIRESEAKKGQ